MKSVAFGLLAAAGFAAAASAGVIYDSQGFEAPLFTAGNVDGQAGWAADPAGHTQHTIINGADGATTPIGSQMLRITQATGTRWSFPDITAGVAGRASGEDWIWCRFDINAPSANTTPAFFGVAAYNSSAALLAAARLRASDGAVIVTLDPDGAGPAVFGSYTLGTPALLAPRGQWINLGVAVNVVTGQAIITSGDSILITGNANAGFATLSDFDAMSGASSTLTQSVYLDNYIVTSESVVPAPATAALLGLGGLVAARRRRN